MANVKVKVKVDPEGIREFLRQNKPVRDMMIHLGHDVAEEAQATASSAEEGAGGTIDGYAAAGFSVVWNQEKRPQVRVVSNANRETATAAHFHTQWRDGVAHLRAALYKFTQRG